MDQLTEITQLLKTQTNHQQNEVDLSISKADTFALEARNLKANISLMERELIAMHERHTQLKNELALITVGQFYRGHSLKTLC